jgi:glycine/sarcosine N-methyltransferase
MSVPGFYDGLASEYHLVYLDWEEAVERQGRVLDALIRGALGNGPAGVLDCACGIGTQAIGLARHGHDVVGTDISIAALDRAQHEAARAGVALTVARADFRTLEGVDGPFDVVINCDNAIPHLEHDDEVGATLASMARVLRPGGLAIISIRDYDRALTERPSSESALIAGPPRRIVARLHDWDGEGPMHTVHIFVITEGADGWAYSHHQTRYRALRRAELELAAKAAGFTDLVWHDHERLGFHQPLLTARLPA